MEKQVGEEFTTTTLLKDDYNTDQLTAVASKWILDFIFIGVCRRFSEQNQDAFNDAFSTYKSISQTPLLEGGSSPEKGYICDFLARVIKGKELGAHFTEDGKDVMPLMSAAKVWLHLKDVVQDESLFDDVTLHLIVQCVSVCLDYGQKSQARGALKWFEEHVQYPHKVGVKLSTVVAEMKPYDPFLSFFGYDRLLEKVQIFLDAYTAKHPSDFLLKEAITAVQLAQNKGATDAVTQTEKSILDTIQRANLKTRREPKSEVVPEKKRVSFKFALTGFLASDVSTDGVDEQSANTSGDGVLSPQNGGIKLEHKRILRNGRILRSNSSPLLVASPDSASAQNGETCLSGDDKANHSGETTARNKRRLFSTKTSLWEPESQVKAQVWIRPLRKKVLNNSIVSPERPLRLKWTPELDKKLVQGVKCHGKGRWFRILQDYDFEGRTGVMLKDRWRILEKNCKVD
ncbi:telomeric repeat-binding factor 1 isoform X2 [Stigmatopora argus]